MDPLCVVVLDVLMKEAVQVPLVESNHVIQPLATNAPDPALRRPVLPRTTVSGSLGLDSEVLDRVEDTIREDRVVVVDPESVGVLFGKRLPELLDRPRRGRVGREIEVQDSPLPVLDDEPHVEQLEVDGRNDEEVHCRDDIPVVSEKGHPALSLALVECSFRQVARHGRQADGEAELLELGLDLPGSPVVLGRETPDQGLQLQ